MTIQIYEYDNRMCPIFIIFLKDDLNISNSLLLLLLLLLLLCCARKKGVTTMMNRCCRSQHQSRPGRASVVATTAMLLSLKFWFESDNV